MNAVCAPCRWKCLCTKCFVESTISGNSVTAQNCAESEKEACIATEGTTQVVRTLIFYEFRAGVPKANKDEVKDETKKKAATADINKLVKAHQDQRATEIAAINAPSAERIKELGEGNSMKERTTAPGEKLDVVKKERITALSKTESLRCVHCKPQVTACFTNHGKIPNGREKNSHAPRAIPIVKKLGL